MKLIYNTTTVNAAQDSAQHSALFDLEGSAPTTQQLFELAGFVEATPLSCYSPTGEWMAQGPRMTMSPLDGQVQLLITQWIVLDI